MAESLLTEADVAGQVKVSPETLRYWRRHHRGPAFLKVGRHVRYRAEDVEAWLAELRHQAAAVTA